MRRIAISDIHGCLESLKRLLEQINLDETDELYFLGDYMDRGPDSKGVLDFMMELSQREAKTVFIRGNHDQIILRLRFKFNFTEMANWLRQGGAETLESFGLKHMQVADIPQQYIDFITAMPFYHEVDDFLLVHAGFNFTAEDIFEDKRSLIWIRRWYEEIDYEKLADRKIVHGHTPTARSVIEENFEKRPYPVVNIDAGCCYAGKVEGMGYLCAYDFTSERLYFQPYDG